MRAKLLQDIDKYCSIFEEIRKTKKRGGGMHLTVKKTRDDIYRVSKTAKHVSPHLHNALEIVHVREGTLELGVGQELYHMEKDDLGFVFSDIIHHYQVFNDGNNEVDYILVPPSYAALFAEEIQKYAPEYPVIKAENIESEVYHAIDSIMKTNESESMVVQAYIQIILARCIKKMNLIDKSSVGSDDLIYRTVAFVSANFRKPFSLEDMARELGVSKYVVSRIFSKTFHCNFNQYLNDARIGYAIGRLENTNDTITDIYLDSGFKSQRTFNRVFKERYKSSPSEYRQRRRSEN